MLFAPALIGALSALAATQARAATAQLFDTLQTFCIAADGQSAAALSTADAAGWIALNKAMVPIPASPTFTLEDYAVRIKSEDTGTKVLIVGRGTTRSPGGATPIPADICMVLSKSGDPGAIPRAAAWAGVEPMASQQGMNLYAFENTSSGHKMPLGAGAAQAFRSGTVKLLVTGAPAASDSVMLGYISLRK